MDRFIGDKDYKLPHIKFDLKSNMDRFIEVIALQGLDTVTDLKSNMDRFIACVCMRQQEQRLRFKIQYG